MVQVILVDDEPRQLCGLALMLQPYAQYIDIVAFCITLENARTSIESLKPDLIFLNVNMYGRKPFELLDELYYTDFEIVFTTGALSFGERAKHYLPIGCLFKPLDESELEHVLKRVIANHK